MFLFSSIPCIISVSSKFFFQLWFGQYLSFTGFYQTSSHLWLYPLILKSQALNSLEVLSVCEGKRGYLPCGCFPGYQEENWPFYWENTIYSFFLPWAVDMPREVSFNPQPDECKPGFQCSGTQFGKTADTVSHWHVDFDLILLFLVRYLTSTLSFARVGEEQLSLCGWEGQDTCLAPRKFFNQSCCFQYHSKNFLASKILLSSLICFISSSINFFSHRFMFAEIIL